MPLDNDNALIGDWNPSNAVNNPQGNETRKEGDDQIRGTKGTVRRHFPGFTGTAAVPKVVNASEDELNRLVGISLTDPIITFPLLTPLIFYLDIAPPGWTIVASVDEHAVRLTKGLAAGGVQGATRGGVNDFGQQFATHAEDALFGVRNHQLTGDESGMPAHTHPNHGHQVLAGWNSGGDTFGTIGLSEQASAGTTPTYSLADPRNPDDEYVALTLTPEEPAKLAAQGHAHTIDQNVKHARCILAQMEP